MSTENTGALARIEQAVSALRRLADISRAIGAEGFYSLRLNWEQQLQRWEIEALPAEFGGEDSDVDAVLAWAHALGGDLHLSEPMSFDYEAGTRTYRRLTGSGDLGGVQVTVWDHIDKHFVPAEPANAEPVAA